MQSAEIIPSNGRDFTLPKAVRNAFAGLSQEDAHCLSKLSYAINSSSCMDDLQRAGQALCTHLQAQALWLVLLDESKRDARIQIGASPNPLYSRARLSINLDVAQFCNWVKQNQPICPLAIDDLPPLLEFSPSMEKSAEQLAALAIFTELAQTAVLFINLSNEDAAAWTSGKQALCRLIAEAMMKQSGYLQEVQALEINGNHLKDILNSSDQIYSYWQPEQGWVFLDDSFFQTLGYSHSQATSNPILEEDRKAYHDKFMATLKSGNGFEHQYRIKTVSGDIHKFHSRIKVLERTPQGITKTVLSITKDITASWRAQEKTRVITKADQWLNDQLTQLFTQSDVPAINQVMQSISEQFGATRCFMVTYYSINNIWNQISEYLAPGEKPILDLWSPEQFEQMSGYIREKFVNKNFLYVRNIEEEINGFEQESFRSTGLHSMLMVPVFVRGEMKGHIGISSPNETVWTEQQIRMLRVCAESIYRLYLRLELMDKEQTSEDRFQSAMEVSSSGIWERDINKKTMYFSPNFYEMLGYDANDLERNPLELVDSLIIEEDKKKLVENFEAFYRNKDQEEMHNEYRHIHKDGHILWIASHGRVVERDREGHPLRIVGALTDITPLKSSLLRLEQMREKAITENASKGEFLARMSHEIRTPMNAIIGMSYLMQQTPLDDEQLSHVNDIESASTALLNIIDDILDFSKIEAGKLSIENRAFDLRKELTRIIKLIALKVAEKDIQVTLNIDEATPNRVTGDKTRVGQVITNLLSNAVKFTDQGEISVTVSPIQHGNLEGTIALLFCVSDTGIGLSEKQCQTLFTPFVQAEQSTARHYGGTGLGLSITKNLVELMGGNIEVVSKVGVGTTFHFTIIFHQTEDNEYCALEAPNLAKLEEGYDERLQGLNVLLVEDNVVNQRVAQGILAKQNINVSLAKNGLEAIKVITSAETGEFDAILMDIEMPELDGIETTRRIRAIDSPIKNIPIIAMTAHTMSGDKEKCLAAGMNDHISKPIKPQLLYNSLANQVAHNRSAARQ